MSSGINLPLNVTVGTTPIVNGTNNTLLRNENGVVGDTDYTVPKTDGTAGQVLQTNGAGVVSFQTISTGITVGTTAVTSGTDGRVFFQAGGVVQQDSNFTYDNTLKRLGLKAVGTAATDIPFVVQNSAGTLNNLTVNGLGLITSNVAAPGSYVWTNHLNSVRYESGSPITNVTIKTNYPFVESFYIGRNTGTANSDASTSAGLVYSHQGEFTVRNTQTGGNYGITLNAEQNLEQRVGIDTGRTAFGLGWSLRNFTNSVDVINFQTNSPRVGIGWNSKGAALGAILDVRAQGALSTDIAFRVRNSNDTADIFSIRGNNNIYLAEGTFNGSNIIFHGSTTSLIRYSHDANNSIAFGQGATFTNGTNYNTVIGGSSSTGASAAFGVVLGWSSSVNNSYGICIGSQTRVGGTNTIKIGNDGSFSSYNGTNSIHLGKTVSGNNLDIDNVFMTYFNSQSSSTLTRANGSFGLLGQQAYIIANGTGALGLTTFMGDGGNTFVVRNHPNVPTLNITDSFQQYSADATLNNAAPHFRTENGSIVKLYQETTGVAAATLVGGGGTTITDTDTFGGYTLQQIAQALKNLGILA
jgi:hypothetical protein